MGRVSGNDLPAREMTVSPPAVGAPRMLMNSVSGEVILWPLSGLDAAARQKVHPKCLYLPGVVGNRNRFR